MKEKKEGKNKKRLIVILSITIGLLLIAAIILLIMFLRKPKYEIKVNSGGGTITRNIIIEDNVIKDLPEITPPKDKVLVAWINDKSEAVRPNLELTGNDTITPVFEDVNRTTVTLSFVSGTDEQIPNIVITKGSTVILPVKPKHDTWKFLYWIDKDGFIVLNNRIITEDTTFYAYWFKSKANKETEEVTIKFETETDEKVDDIKLVKGSDLIFPSLTKEKEGMVFRGWLDEEGNKVTNQTKANKNMTLKANWKEPYTCPADCTPSEDHKTCSKTTVVAPTKQTVCPGTEYYGQCIDTSQLFYDRQCNSWSWGDEVDYTIGDRAVCAKKIDRVEQLSCPEGFNKDGETCKKIETINCTAN